MKKVEVTIEVVENGQVLTSYTDVKNYSTTGQDLEYEQVADSNGSPLVRPKNPPKY